MRDAAGRVKSEDFKNVVVLALMDEKNRKRIASFIQRADGVTIMERERRSDLANEDLLEEMLSETTRAIEAVVMVRSEIQFWVRPPL